MRVLARYLSAAALALAAWSGAQAQTAFTLASSPLNVANSIAPNVMFALSVEFPTAITPAYTSSYSSSTEYLGYFDPKKCYTYSQTLAAAAGTQSTAWFAPAGLAAVSGGVSLHTCTGKWSGNFLNWVSMAGLDEFRYAMTGGTRYIDTTSDTVLQRSYQTNQGGNFSDKTVTDDTILAGATPLTSNMDWTFQNSGRGNQMRIVSGSTSYIVWVQVKVCDNSSGAGGLESNCTGYTNSSTGVVTYKPTGSVQNNADGMRFGVFSYYNDNSIDNAVMRAKMKFTGRYAYNASGVQSTNAFKEWDPETGIYVTHPDSGDSTLTTYVSAARSGVINYINLFGTGVNNGNNRYKTYDNVSKLYYEALAYLRKRTLDSGFYNGANTNNSDDFPVYSAYTEDPVQAYCQKNFIFMMGDTHTWCDKRLPGGTFTNSNNSACDNPVSDKNSLSNGDTLDVSTWTNNIQSGLATSYTGVGNASYYMSGMAYWAHVNDIRPDLNTNTTNKTTVTTYIIDVQESNDTGINSQYWRAAKYGGFDTTGGVTSPTSSSLPSTSNWATYDTLYNSSGSTDGTSSTNNGVRPKTYLPAGNPQAMITAVNSAFSQISAATKGDAAVSSSSGDLRFTGSAYLYQSTFTSVQWTGDLKAYSITIVTSGATTSATPAWQASTKLDAGSFSATNRVVLSYNDGVSAYAGNTTENATLSRQGISFKDPNDLSTAQRAALNTNVGGVTDSQATARINYIRGDKTNEGAGLNFRSRISRLGDIVHSQPAYVGPPTDVSFEPGYVSFAINNQSRSPVIYVGANDGMLHGFNADSTSANVGAEVMAYVPSPVVRNLNKLTSSSYTHTFFVDASPAVENACPNGCSNSASWKTVLVSGLGAGGQGIFALNVTSPTFTAPSAGAASSTVMWEFTDSTDADLGYTFGKPLIVKMNNGKWAAVFGNGYNNSTSDGRASTTGRGALYIVFLSGPSGSNQTWTVNTDYIKLVPGVTGSIPGTTAIPNGLGAPVAVDSDLDGDVDYLYAGDIYGNVWKFDVTSSTATSWTTAFSGAPFFSARDASGKVQPITGGLGVSFSKYGGFMVNFGTGSYIGTNDNNTTDVQTLYGVLDRNDGTKPPTTAIGTAPSWRNVSTTNSLQQQALIGAGYTTGSASAGNFTIVATSAYDCSQTPTGAKCVVVQSDCRVNFPGLNLTTTQATTAASCPASVNGKNLAVSNPPVQLGWYFDLPNSAERAPSDFPIIESSTLQVTTLVPSGEACSGGLQGYQYIVDVDTGSRTTSNVFDLSGSGISNSSQMLTIGGVAYVVSGTSLASGSSVNTPARFTLPSSNATTGAAGSTGGAGGTALGCPSGTFVPGWGCVGTTGGGIQRSAQCFGSGTGNCDGLFLPGQKSRLYWRQLFTN
jgi:type IV pilus assembly protein PilY1